SCSVLLGPVTIGRLASVTRASRNTLSARDSASAVRRVVRSRRPRKPVGRRQSHTIWFHRPLRVDAWLLLHHENPTVSGARGFGTAHVFGEDGALVASFAQESLLREMGA
ncbi:MAG TPA: hypothetical protein EYG46_05500, partial [Myxococcales bacterium]|nr:hypothetical protein [Myxococcales bacterium]